MKSDSVLAPSFAVATCGAIWGIYWIPVRNLAEIGISAAWASLVPLAVTAIVFVFVFSAKKFTGSQLSKATLLTGLIVGTSVTLYTVSLAFTEVIKTVLLFYLTPVWSTILGRWMLNERISLSRIVAVIVGISGLAVILGIGKGFPTISNAGDLMALIAGVMWSYGSIRIKLDTQESVWDHVGAFHIGGTGAAMVFVLLPLPALAPLADWKTLLDGFFWLLIITLAYLPSAYLIFRAAQILSPARIGILLMTEIIVGVVTAAWLSGEPFTWPHLVGTTLIVGAVVIDVSDRFLSAKLPAR